MASRVLVAVDESEAAQRAVEFTNDFFDALDVELLVLNVADVPVPWFPGVGGAYVGPFAWRQVEVGAPGEDMSALIDAAEAEAETVASQSGIEDGEAIAKVGDPVEVIRSTAAAEAAALIVVGRSEKGWWRRLLEGSVADELVRSADCPVLLVR